MSFFLSRRAAEAREAATPPLVADPVIEVTPVAAPPKPPALPLVVATPPRPHTPRRR